MLWKSEQLDVKEDLSSAPQGILLHYYHQICGLCAVPLNFLLSVFRNCNPETLLPMVFMMESHPFIILHSAS